MSAFSDSGAASGGGMERTGTERHASALPASVLVVGSGSIAERHVRNLLALGVREVVVVTARDVTGAEPFSDPAVRVVPSLPADPPKVAIVANDTDKHVSTTRALVALGADVLVEKPVAAGLSAELDALIAETAEAGAVVRVAYNLRFIGAFGEIVRVLERGELGTRLFARIEVGQWLPDWRPARPLAGSYSSSVERGGGVALDLSHEVDYMVMLFGEPSSWHAQVSATGVLGIEAPDVFDGVYAFPDGFSCSVHMDYLERTPRRRMRIVGSEAVVECDIPGGSLTLSKDGRETRADAPALFDGPGTYVSELRSFFEAVARTGETEGPRLPTLEEARDVLRLLEEPVREIAERGRA